MSETFGNLIDKLSIVNVKLFHVQDQIHEAAVQESETYSQRAPEDTQEIFRKVTALNLERTSLIREIDQYLLRAVSTGQVEVAAGVKLV